MYVSVWYVSVCNRCVQLYDYRQPLPLLLNLDFFRLITQPDPEQGCKQRPKPLSNIRSQIDKSIEGLSISLVPLARIVGLGLPSE